MVKLDYGALHPGGVVMAGTLPLSSLAMGVLVASMQDDAVTSCAAPAVNAKTLFGKDVNKRRRRSL